MSFLAGMGGPLAGALGGAINPTSGLGMAGGPTGGIGMLSKLFGGGGGDDSPQPNAAASGLGKLIGVDPAKISSIAQSIGGGMNQIAQGGGASPGYAAPPQAAPSAQAPTMNNILQGLNPEIIQALIRSFSGNSAGGQIR